MSPTLSICIPTYNRAPYLEQLLDSVLPQCGYDVELVVSDNASTDSTKELIERHILAGHNIVYVEHSENQGADRNFLACVEAASGRYCWFVGSDDVLFPYAVETILGEIKQQSEDIVGFIVSKLNFDKDLINPRSTHDAMIDHGGTTISITENENLAPLLAGSFGYIGAVCVCRQRWLAIDPAPALDTAYVHVYILQMLLASGGAFRCITKPLLMWRYENDSILAESRAVGRLQIELNYIQISRKVFGVNAFTDAIATEIGNANITWQIISHKINQAYSIKMLAICWENLKSLPVFYFKILPVCLIPGAVLRWGRSFYRFALKPAINRSSTV